jgi:hypothetical protein
MQGPIQLEDMAMEHLIPQAHIMMILQPILHQLHIKMEHQLFEQLPQEEYYHQRA